MSDSSLPSAAEQRPQRQMPEGRRFVRGVSGNPLGRSRDEHATVSKLRKLAASLTPEALHTVAAIMRDASERTCDRLRAADILIGTGHAHAVRLDEVLPDLHVVVQQLPPSSSPIPGVLNSPNVLHIDPRARARIGLGSPQPVIDAVTSEVAQ